LKAKATEKNPIEINILYSWMTSRNPLGFFSILMDRISPSNGLQKSGRRRGKSAIRTGKSRPSTTNQCLLSQKPSTTSTFFGKY
jgi:hypothetical protein